ncbi:hypothetical protein WJX72_001471 [[Myrmecia] bisecta]|uniref:Diacylglycerol kinase n=1 Tax=[Myrmecia] bisecta TaxID=41462 RepID=A0AAW1Q620_9CHLO
MFSIILLALFLIARAIARWHSVRRGITNAAIAGAAIAELRRSNPDLYPPAPHAWYRLPLHQLTAPQLCAVCYQHIQMDGDTKRVQCCEVCGTLAHEGCVRHVPHDCRPAAMQVEHRMVHMWKPAGVAMIQKEEEAAGEAAVQPPAQHAHRPPDSNGHVAEADHNGLANGLTSSKDGVENELGAFAEAVPGSKRQVKKAKRQRSFGLSDGARPAASLSSLVAEDVGEGSKAIFEGLTSDHQWETPRKHRRVNSFGAFINTLASAVGGSLDGDALRDAQPSDARLKRHPSEVDVSELDTCHLGAHWRLVLPPTSVRLLPSATWSSRAQSFLRRAAKKKGKSKAAGSSATGGSDGGSSSHRPSWWRGAHVRWQDYRIEDVPVGCKPLLVFLNTKSGPQVGLAMRRKFLRMLNPLQVVELPREKPEPALQLFARVPNLRIMVVGGDGTVGWIMGCLDVLKEALEAEPGGQPWTMPPIAVFPLGTGNDLARCLNWGSGLHEFQHSGMSAILKEVEQATVALLDRWTVSIQPAKAARAAGGQGLPQRSASGRIGQSISGMRKQLGKEPAEQKAVKKTLNNYLGIGIDAKVALEFHQVREQYPGWFQSQMGNKLWYTTLGAKYLGDPRDLPAKLQVECDGELIELPGDIEGILLLNINSYMGGVDLWGSGATGPPHQDQAPQSFCDGRLEVVAVYGTWHLGQLQVGLSGAKRLCQCRTARISTREELPMQIDGEPWKQGPATLEVGFKDQAFMLRRVSSEPMAQMAHIVAEVLEGCQAKGVISQAQRMALTTELATKLHPVL